MLDPLKLVLTGLLSDRLTRGFQSQEGLIPRRLRRMRGKKNSEYPAACRGDLYSHEITQSNFRQNHQRRICKTPDSHSRVARSGSGTLAGGVHSATFDEIAQAEAMEISEILQKQFDRDVLDAVTPGEQAWAYFELAANEETDTNGA